LTLKKKKILRIKEVVFMENMQNRNDEKQIYCICPKCGEQIKHKLGTPCHDELCPKCDTKMIQGDSSHHRSQRRRNREYGKE
jgi:hypothetical protein